MLSSHKKSHHLQIWDADVEGLIHVGVPHQSDVCDEKRPQITLQK